MNWAELPSLLLNNYGSLTASDHLIKVPDAEQ